MGRAGVQLGKDQKNWNSKQRVAGQRQTQANQHSMSTVVAVRCTLAQGRKMGWQQQEWALYNGPWHQEPLKDFEQGNLHILLSSLQLGRRCDYRGRKGDRETREEATTWFKWEILRS